MAQSDYITNDVDLLRDIAARADQRVAAQLTTALAADQRAMTFAGLLAAAAAVLGGAAASVLTATAVSHHLGLIALIAALVCALGSALAVGAARPSIFFLPGTVPLKWLDDVQQGTKEIDRLPSLLADYDDRIAKNERHLKQSGRILMASAALTLMGLTGCGIAAAYISRTAVAKRDLQAVRPDSGGTKSPSACVVRIDDYRRPTSKAEAPVEPCGLDGGAVRIR